MTAPAHHRGSGMHLAPELVVRQVLVEGLHELLGDETRLRELVERFDDLPQGTQDVWADEMLEAYRALLNPDEENGVQVRVGYPRDQAHLPWLSIVLEQGNENEGEAVMGDVLGRRTELIGDADPNDLTSCKPIGHTDIGVGWSSVIQVASWDVSAERSLLLHAVANHLLFRHKGRLATGGVHEVSFSDNGFVPEGSPLAGIVGYVPMLRCTMRWTRRQTRVTNPVYNAIVSFTNRGGNS